MRKLKCNIEDIEGIKSQIYISDEEFDNLVSIMSEEIRKEIDKEILNKIRKEM